MENSLFCTIGLMSGTSMDGIDAAVVWTDGQEVVRMGSFMTIPYDVAFRQRLRSCLGGKGPVVDVERELTLRHAQAVRLLLEKEGLKPAQVDMIGFHGHTIHHAPERRMTWQIGDGTLLAEETGIAVVNDFRSNDVSLGGQGAPLVPVFHRALCAQMEKPIAILNIGGVANVTWLGADDSLLAFDTGPGNALIDDWVLHQAGTPFDKGGKIAAMGTVDSRVLSTLMDHPYFTNKAPKSLDRDTFSPAPVRGMSLVNGAATLTAFTAVAVEKAVALFPEKPKKWLVTGGGRLNVNLLERLEKVLGCPMLSVESVGWSGDALEAQAFGYLAARSHLKLPISFPTTTGVPHPTTGGRFHPVVKKS